MSFSFCKPKLKNSDDEVNQVIFLDVDDTVAKPARKSNGEYEVREDGFIDASLIDQEIFKKFVQLAILNNVPLYFITGRPDIEPCKQLLHGFVKKVDGFNEGIGGFKSDSIYFISKLITENGSLVRKEIMTKCNLIAEIHKKKYKHLKAENILLIDDMDNYLEPATKLGYATIKACPKTLLHFQAAELWISSALVSKDTENEYKKISQLTI